ncbi:hypothetical protein ACQ4PT_058512 [Festuca glaucescens]
MGKPKGRRAGSSGAAAAKKDKATGWAASTFSKADLNKLRAIGLLAAATELHQFTPNSIIRIACFVTLCECFLGVDPHCWLWRRIFCIRRNVSQTTVHDVGGAIISTKSPSGYFDLRMRDSVQDWRKKWFYVKDEPAAGQTYGLAPFDAAAEVKKLKSWDIPLTTVELEETEPMMQKIQALQSTVGKELSGLQLMALFMRMCIQPLQDRAHQMWNYVGSADETRVSKDDVAEDEDHRFLSSLPPLPEGGSVPEVAVATESEAADTGATLEVDDDDKEDALSEASHARASPPSATSHEEKEVQKKQKRTETVDDSESSGEAIPSVFPSSSYADDTFAMPHILSKGEGLRTELHTSDEDAGLDDFVVARVTDPLATTAESSKPKDFDESPRALAKKKAKTSGALKGIQISSTPSSPPRDHPLSREMLDVATRFIGLEAGNQQLRSDYELEHSRAQMFLLTSLRLPRKHSRLLKHP